MPASIIPFPVRQIQARTSGVRIAYVAEGWCVERLAGGAITGRNSMPSRKDAERIALRISRRDGAALLPPATRPCPWSDHHGPDAA